MITTTLDLLQWAGCATGVAGALLLALNTKQVFFTATSLLGVYRWLVVARQRKNGPKAVSV